jgi:hypothetical protein
MGDSDDNFGDGDNCDMGLKRKTRSRWLVVNKNYSHYTAL